MTNTTPIFQYRSLAIEYSDENAHKTRGGDKPVRWFYVEDSGREDYFHVPDELGEDRNKFLRRAEKAVIAYLDQLGADGWKLVSFVPSTSPTGASRGWPIGHHILLRKT